MLAKAVFRLAFVPLEFQMWTVRGYTFTLEHIYSTNAASSP